MKWNEAWMDMIPIETELFMMTTNFYIWYHAKMNQMRKCMPNEYVIRFIPCSNELQLYIKYRTVHNIDQLGTIFVYILEFREWKSFPYQISYSHFYGKLMGF